MTSSRGQHETYVWLYLPDAREPVVCGRLSVRQAGPESIADFVYGRSYLQRTGAMALSPHDLPLQRGVHRARRGLHGVLRDAAPDAWGRRVLLHRLRMSETQADAELTEIDFLLGGGDRPGALHFQSRADSFEPPERPPRVSLSDLSAGVLAVERNQPMSEELLAALEHGTSIGGARPKALVEHESRPCIAKFASSTDTQPMIALEAVALALARRCGIETAPTEVIELEERQALLIDRFDLGKGHAETHRRHFFSALTALELDEMEARYAGYPLLADYLRRYAYEPADQCRILFERMVFNILVGNTDDHARNHALFWDGQGVSLTPAYDLCVWPRMGGEASQAMDVGDQGKRATMANALSQSRRFGLSQDDALAICRDLANCIRDNWTEACRESGLPNSLRDQLMGTVVLAPSAIG